MDIELLTVGKTTIGFVAEAIAEYEKRLKRYGYISFRITSLPDVRKGKSMPETVQKEEEGKLILRQLQTSDRVILLDERGKEMTSEGFSSLISRHIDQGTKRVVFVVGGPYGFSQAVYDRADSLLSLSRMTFNHEMVRAFFTEQVYRAMTIINGEPYHHA